MFIDVFCRRYRNEKNNKLLKKTALVLLIYSVVIGIVSYFILTNKELSYTIGSYMFKLISLKVPSYADVYVSILLGVVSLLALLLFIFLGACFAAKSGGPRYQGTIYANGQSADIYIK